MTRTTKPTAAKPKEVQSAADKQGENDPLYIKAKNEIDGHTLIPLNKIEGNKTVKRVGDAVYGNKATGELVIAKRVSESDQDEGEEAAAE